MDQPLNFNPESGEQVDFNSKLNPQKKAIITGMLILVGSALVGVSFKLNLWNKLNFQTTAKSISVQKWQLQNAKILEATPDHVVVRGLAKSPSGQVKELTLNLRINSETVVKNINVKITEQQLRSGESFGAVPEILTGKISDLVPNTRIAGIRTLEDIFKVNKTRAIEIDYLTQTHIYESAIQTLPVSPKILNKK